MFDRLSSSFQRIFKNLRGYGKLSESNVQEALREVRLALLEADVNFQVVKEFVQRVREKCVGIEVLDSVTPGQQVIKFVHDEMVALLGGRHKEFDFSGRPAVFLMIGLHGSGKTTTSAKLARRWKKGGKNVLLVACDIRRPAAVDQLRILADQVGVGLVAPLPGETVPALGARAMAHARDNGYDIAVFDTGGRFQIDEELVQELKELRAAIQPQNALLVLDAAIGQESVHVAETFHREIGLTGLILTKLDGDARGGAALSVQHVTGCPILLVGTGEKAEDLEPFYPDRMASRILGMGDIVSFVEKAQEALAQEDLGELQEEALKGDLDFEDFLTQLRRLKKLGPMENLLEMLPGHANVPAHVKGNLSATSGKEMKRTEAIILSMTPRERRRPDLIDASRKRRIAAGSGVQVSHVNELLRRFDAAKKMTKQFKKQQKRLLKFGR
jgi:signal recognition particle subunit SRP54